MAMWSPALYGRCWESCSGHRLASELQEHVLVAILGDYFVMIFYTTIELVLPEEVVHVPFIYSGPSEVPAIQHQYTYILQHSTRGVSHRLPSNPGKSIFRSTRNGFRPASQALCRIFQCQNIQQVPLQGI